MENRVSLEKAARDDRFDNIRFLLMFLVIFGHGIELFNTGFSLSLYKIIYAFHMPAFLFLSGRFAKFDAKKILRHLVVPYFVFQILYLVFTSGILSSGKYTLQFTTPYWILWYLLALIFSYLLLPLLPEKTSVSGLIPLALSVCVALLVGFDKTVGRYLSLSRFLVFLPFFLAGYYGETILGILRKHIHLSRAVVLTVSAVGFVGGEAILLSGNVPLQLLYGAVGYEAAKSTVLMRAVALLTAAFAIVLLCGLMPNRRIPILSELGKNTMPVYLLHGFVMKLLGEYDVFRFSEAGNLLLAFALAALLYLLFGNRYVAKVFKKVF